MRSTNGERACADDLRCVLFDLDNTLVPFFPALHVWAAAWADHAAPRAVRESVTTALLDHTFGDGEQPAEAMKATALQFGLDVALLTDAADKAHAAYLAAIKPYAGMERTIRQLDREGLTLAVVTDAPGWRAHERLEASRLSGHFSTVITRDMTPHGKRGREPFDLVLGELGFAPEEAAMVGDFPAIDAAWPNRLGMRSVLAGWGHREGLSAQSHWERPWAVARRPSQVPAILRQPGPGPERPLSDWVG